MAILFSAIAGALLMLTVADIITGYHIAFGLIIILAIIGIELISNFWNWRMDRR